MKPYFTDEKLSMLRVAVEKWRGTPFHESIIEPRKGGQCMAFVMAVYRDCGVPTEYAPIVPRWSQGHGKHHTNSILLQWLADTHEALANHPGLGLALRSQSADEDVMAGDLVIVKAHKSANHIAVCDGENRIAHIDRDRGFCRDSIDAIRGLKAHHSTFRLYHV